MVLLPGRFFDFDAIRKQIGLDEEAGTILEAMKKMSPQQKARTEKILRHQEQKAVDQSTLNDGAEKTLTELRKAGIHIGILTRNKKSNALAVAEKHNLKFDIVIGREEGPVKPDSFGLLYICREFGVEPHETMLVGDYLFDLLCAKAAGAVAVLIKNHNDCEDFIEHADFHIDRIDQVLDLVSQCSRSQ